MKSRFLVMLLAPLLLSCAGNGEQTNDSALRSLCESRKQTLEKDGISIEYDSTRQRMNLTSKGDVMTVSYNVVYTDLTGPTPKSSAHDFVVSMVVAADGAQSISCVVFDVEGVKMRVTPSTSESIGNGFVIGGLSTLDKSFCELMQILQNIVLIDEAYVVTDKGSIKIPHGDIMNLSSMAQSYIIDGGSFEYKQ